MAGARGVEGGYAGAIRWDEIREGLDDGEGWWWGSDSSVLLYRGMGYVLTIFYLRKTTCWYPLSKFVLLPPQKIIIPSIHSASLCDSDLINNNVERNWSESEEGFGFLFSIHVHEDVCHAFQRSDEGLISVRQARWIVRSVFNRYCWTLRQAWKNLLCCLDNSLTHQ